jgi:hypothetical protein
VMLVTLIANLLLALFGVLALANGLASVLPVALGAFVSWSLFQGMRESRRIPRAS